MSSTGQRLDLEAFALLERLPVPLVVMLGGATGTGKSSIATELAYRLGVIRVTSTDVVRQTMRAFFSPEFMPSIHQSSFQAGAAMEVPDGSEQDIRLHGFLEQTRNVLVGVKALVGRAIEEGYSMVVEGVHLVPGLVPIELPGALVCHTLVAISEPEEHASHFWIRDVVSGGVRPVAKYLDALEAIRAIQDYLVAQAEKHGVPVVWNSHLDAAVDTVEALILDQARQAL